MADDNEFQERKERENRIKNIEYQIEEEEKVTAKRKEREKTRLERTRKQEFKKAEAKKAEAAKKRKAAEEEKAKKKKQQQEAREIMEQKRQEKHPDKKVTKTTTRKEETTTASAATTGTSASEIAKDGVSADIYFNGKEISEKELPQDLVNKIRKEQNKAIREAENQIKGASTDGDINSLGLNNSGISGLAYGKEENDNLKSGRGRNSGIFTSGNGTNAIPGLDINVQKSKPTTVATGRYSTPNKSGTTSEDGSASSASNTNDTINNSDSNKTDGDANNGIFILNNPNIKSRDALRSNLANINKISNNNDIDEDNDNNLNKNETLSRSNDGIFTKEPSGAKPSNIGNSGDAPGINRDNLVRRNSPRKGGSTAGTPESINGRDIDSEVSRQMLDNMGRASRIAKGTTKKALSMAKTVKTAMKAKKLMTLGPLLAFAGIIILILILLVGAASFIMNMPGMVRDKFEDTWDSFWQNCKGLVFGMDQPSDKQVKNLAEYLESMGYDLKYNGFATKLEKDKNGNIKEIESKYLKAYIAAEQRGYLLANENHDVKSIWKGMTGQIPADQPWGTGMVVLEETLMESILNKTDLAATYNLLVGITRSLTDFFTGKGGNRNQTKVTDLSALQARVIIKRDTKEMYISKVDIIDAFNKGGYDVYRYSLKDWIERYNTPTELFTTIQLATRAPEFAYKWATTYDTKVFMNIKELTNVDVTLVYAETDKDNKIRLDENGKPIMKPISEMSDEEIKKKGISQEALAEMRKVDNKKVKAFTPYITKVLNHWYYQQVIFQGEYNGKQINVYEEQQLSEGDPGYVRYYAYTRRDNADASQIKKDSEKEEPAPDSLLWGIYNVIAKIIVTIFTCGAAGASGIMESVSEELLQEAFEQIGEYAFDQLSDKLSGLLPDQLAGMLNVSDWLNGSFSFDQLSNLNIGNMGDFVSFDKIFDGFNLENMNLDVGKLWEQLNVTDVLANIDISGFGSLNDIQNVIQKLDLSNLNDVFSNSFGNIIDLSNVNFDDFTNQLLGGFSGSMGAIQDNLLQTCTLFSGLSDADFSKISNGILDSFTNKITDFSAGPIIDELTGQIKDTVNGKFNTQILSGLQNEFSKQLTGLPYSDLSKLASIKGMDFNQIKELSGQVTGISSALKGAQNSISNLSNNVNQISKDITGIDTRVLSSVTDGLTKFDNTVGSLEQEILSTKQLLSNSNLLQSEAKELLNKLEELQNNMKLLKEASSKLDIKQMNILQEEINTCKSDISDLMKTIKNIEPNTLGQIQSKMSNLQNIATSVIENLDVNNLATVVYKLPNLDRTGIIQLAKDLINLDVSANGMEEVIRKYGTDLTGLNTSEISTLMNAINGYNVSAQDAINGVSKYLLKVDETGLANNLSQLNKTVNLISDTTEKFDINKAAQLASMVPGIDSLHLEKLASQISGLANTDVEALLRKVEELPKQILQQVSSQLTEQITNGIKEQITQNLAGKLKDNILSTNGFAGKLKGVMTGGENKVIDVEAEEQTIENSYAEYSTGFYVREIRTADYFQKAEPTRVIYPNSHWRKMFREDKYVILDSAGIDINKIADKDYIEKYGRTIWDATDGNVEANIYGMLQGIQSADAQYLFRYFKELFNDFSWVFDSNYGFSQPVDPNRIKDDTIGWIFKTAKVQEKVNDTEYKIVEKAEYEPYTWAASKVGILNPKSQDRTYGFKQGLDIVSPVNGVVIAKTEARENEMGQRVAESVTIELRNTGDENADGIRIILIGGDYSGLMVGSLLRKIDYIVDAEGNYTGQTEQSVIGKTTNEPIKIMVLDKDQTPVTDVSDYIYPPYEQYKAERASEE